MGEVYVNKNGLELVFIVYKIQNQSDLPATLFSLIVNRSKN